VPRGRRLVVDDDVVARVSAKSVDRSERQAIADAGGAAHGALDDEMREAAGSGRHRVLGGQRTLQRAEDTDQEEIEKDEEQDPHAPEQDRERDLHLVGGAELQLDTADREAVSVGQHYFGDPPAVHVRAVGALEVVERVAAKAQPDLGMLA